MTAVAPLSAEELAVWEADFGPGADEWISHIRAGRLFATIKADRERIARLENAITKEHFNATIDSVVQGTTDRRHGPPQGCTHHLCVAGRQGAIRSEPQP